MRFRRKSLSPSQQVRQSLLSQLDEIEKRQAETGKKLEEIEAPKTPELPVEQGDEPIRALKAAYLTLTPYGIFFAPLNGNHGNRYMQSVYGPEATAVCYCTEYKASSLSGYQQHLRHENLSAETACGFYAWKRHVAFPWQSGTWLLEVDLYGRVIEHEDGYRATRQRVLRISPVPGEFCEDPLVLGIGEMFDQHTGFTGVPGTALLTAYCEHDYPQPQHPVSVERLRKRLNVEIDLGWASKLRDGTLTYA